MNHLENLLAEWLTYKGYFIQRNIKLEISKKGGYEGEIDIVAYHHDENVIRHYEISSDSWSKEKRIKKFSRKFNNARTKIEEIRDTISSEAEIENVLIHLRPGKADSYLKMCKVIKVDNLLNEIVNHIMHKRISSKSKSMIDESFPLLRTIEMVAFIKE